MHTAPHVDKKRTIDLSPSRLEGLARVDAHVCDELGTDFGSAVGFFESVTTTVLPRVLAASADAGKVQALRDDDVFNYRMVHYYAVGNGEEKGKDEEENATLHLNRTHKERERSARCGEHRDFGSVTLVFQDGIQGLQIKVDNEWRNVQSEAGNAALLQFGWCAMFRSNGRLPAVLHRVVEPPRNADSDSVPDRTAVIFFVAPGADAALNPVVLPGEKKLFRETTVNDLKTFDGRNWMYREGTIKGEEKEIKERERLIWPTQDSAIKYRYFVGDDGRLFE